MAAAAFPTLTQTQVCTVASTPPLTLRLTSRPEDAIDWLAGVLDRFKEWDDPLSKDLFNWGVRVLDVVPAGSAGLLTSDREFLGAAQAHLHELRDRILIDPLSTVSLEKPLLETNRHVWEERIARGWIGKLSPHSGEMLEQSSLRVHEFACEMLRWLHTFVRQAESPTASTALVVRDGTTMDRQIVALLSDSQMDPNARMLVSFLSASFARQIERERATRITLEEATRRIEQSTAETRVALVQQEEVLKQERERAVAAVEGRIQELGAAQRLTVDGLITQQTLLEGQVAIQTLDNERLQGELEQRGREMRALRAKNAELAERNAALARRVDNISSCTLL